MAKKAIFKMAVAAILNFENFNFWSRDCNICYSVPNFIEIGQFFTEIWRFNDFQNGGRPPSWILKICIFCLVALVNMPFCFLIQISLKSDNRPTSNGQKSNFQDGGRRHLEF